MAGLNLNGEAFHQQLKAIEAEHVKKIAAGVERDTDGAVVLNAEGSYTWKNGWGAVGYVHGKFRKKDRDVVAGGTIEKKW